MQIKIGEKKIGKNAPTYIIAEAGVNHNCEIKRAIKLIRKAADSGADAIKFQTYKADLLVTRNAPRFWKWSGEEKPNGTQYDSYSRLDKLPEEAYYKIVEECKKNKIEFLSTPFDRGSADFLVNLGINAFKIASSDITYLPFLKYVAKKKLPMIVSTGASNIGEIEQAVKTIRDAGNKKIALLHCILSYPAPYEDMNLNMMRTIRNVFRDLPVGLSDHSLGLCVPVATAALGADIIEKHFTLSKNLPLSADHKLAVTPLELKQMVSYIRNVEKALGSWEKQPVRSEMVARKYARRSIVAKRKINKGEKIKKPQITCKRPGTGIEPKFLQFIIGKRAKKDIDPDTVITWEDIYWHRK